MTDLGSEKKVPHDVVAEARRVGNAYSRSLKEVYRSISALRKDKNLDPARKKAALQNLYDRLSWKDVKSSFSGDVVKNRVGVSFRASISHTRLIKDELKKQGLNIARGGNPKNQDRSFAEALGVPTPGVVTSSVPYAEIEVAPRTVIKPIHGSSSRGVFLIGDDLTATSVYSGVSYQSFHQGVRAEFDERTLAKKRRWIVEKLVGTYEKPAYDLKVFTFYGEPVLVEEIHRNADEHSRNLFCFYRPDGEQVYVDRRRHRYQGTGFPPEVLEYASRVSINTPAPFIRVDFLCSEGQVVLGEITPHPGGTYHGQIFEKIDKMLGQKFIEAEGRLSADLLRGKDFSLYLDTYSSNRK